MEKEHFPRFHVGESLLPAESPLFEKLDFDVRGLPGLYKQGADFIDERSDKFGRFSFAEALDNTYPHAWQVERAPFDHALLGKARAFGAEVREGCAVRCVDLGDDQVTVHTAEGTHHGRFLVDATGRDRLLSKQHHSFERVDGLGLAAVFGHYENLGDSARQELEETGNIIVLMLEQGWAWLIPLVGARLSVGFVSHQRGVVSKEWFEEQVAASPLLMRLTEGASRSDLSLTGDYSYRNTRPLGTRFCCIGDAGGFLDPVFSSGIALAMAAADKLAELLGPALHAGTEGSPALLAPLETHMDHAYTVFDAVLRSFYHTRLVDNLFFYDDPDPRLRAGLISILAGDVWRDDNPFQQMLLRRNAKRFARTRTQP